jgi:hypothetical protein
MVDRQTLIGGLAAVATVVAGIALLGDGDEQSPPLTRVRQVLGTTEGDDGPGSSDGGLLSGVSNPFDADVAGILDESVGDLDENVGGTVQDAADSLGDGPGDLVDSIASESVGQAAVRSLFPGVASAETAAEAGEDLVENRQSPAQNPPGSGDGDDTFAGGLDPEGTPWEGTGTSPEPDPNVSVPEPDDSGSFNEFDDPDTDAIETEVPGITIDPSDVGF